jgi:hypothetical protein
MKNQILGYLGSKVFSKEYRSVLEAQHNPVAAQDQAFEQLRATLKSTVVSIKGGLEAEGLKRADWIHASSLSDYGDIEGLVKDCLQGTKGGLFHGAPAFVGLSSGTTGHNSKLIPFSQTSMGVFKRFQRKVAAIVHQQSKINLLSEGRVTWGTNPALYQDERGLSHGYVSGYLSVKSPRILRRTNFPCVETMMINDMELKIEEALVELMSVNHIRVLSGVPSYLIQLLESLCAALGSSDLATHWPQMNTVVYSGTTIAPYKDRIEKLIGKKINFVGIYVSTECPFGFEMPELNSNQNGVYSLNFEDVLFSFRDLNAGENELLALEDLRVGQEVEILVSMPNGLLNYRTGDCVKVISNKPYLFELCGRIGQALNVSTEKVSQSQIAKAVERVNAELGAVITHYFVSPDTTISTKPVYRWTVFVEESSAFFGKEQLLSEWLDESLMLENGDYQENRLDLKFLGSPVVNVLPAAWIQSYFQKKCIKGQLKIKTTFETLEQMQNYVNQIRSEVITIKAPSQKAVS